jgi:DNA-binding transcriptional regulator YiaG
MAHMTPDDFKQGLRTLGVTQTEFAQVVGASRRAALYWTQQAVPGPVATLLRIFLARPELLEVARAFAQPTPIDD